MAQEMMSDHVMKLFSIEKFKKFQSDAIKSLFDRKDVFVGQPTGSGKSMVFLTLPFLNGVVVESFVPGGNVHGREESIFIDTKKCVIVVSPLESLMSDQIKSLEVKGIRSVKLKQVMDEEVQEVRI